MHSSRRKRSKKTQSLSEILNRKGSYKDENPKQWQNNPVVNPIEEREKFKIKTGNCGPEMRIEGGKSISKRTQIKKNVKVCNICGHRGFSNALMYCSKCSNTAAHQYCLGILPGSIDDSFDWLCEYCSPVMERECCTSPEEFTEALVLENDPYENGVIPIDEELKPLCVLPPFWQNGSSEQNETGSISVAQEESEAPVSSFMESPKEIMNGAVLLASLSGKIVIQCGMSFYPPYLVSNFDKPVEKHREDLYECVVQETSELGDCKTEEENGAVYSDEDSGFSDGKAYACQKNTSEDGLGWNIVVIGLPAFGTQSLNGIKRKRRDTLVKFDLIPSLGPECKRARSKRCKLAPLLRKELDACKLTISGVPAIGTFIEKERSDRHINGQEVVTLIKRPGTSANMLNLMRDEMHVEAINQECGLFNGMVVTCGSDVKESAAQKDEKFNHQEMTQINSLELAHFANVHGGNEIVACSQESDKRIPFSNEGLERSEVFTSPTHTFSSMCVEAHSFTHRFEVDGNVMTMPRSCRECDVEICDLTLGIGREALNDNVPHFQEVTRSTMQRQSLMCSTKLTSPVPSDGQTQSLLEKCMECHVIVGKSRDGMEDVVNNDEKLKESIIYPNAWKDYNAEIQKLMIKLEGEKKKLDEVVKKNRCRMWKVVYELESTKRELQGKILELAKKTAEVEMAKDLAIKGCQDSIDYKKNAYELWMRGYSCAENVIYQLHPELNWDGIKAMGNLMFLHF